MKLVGSTDNDNILPRHMGELVIAFRIGATTDRLTTLARLLHKPLPSLQSRDRLCTPSADVEIGIKPWSGLAGVPNILPIGHSPAKFSVLPIKVVRVLGVVGPVSAVTLTGITRLAT